MKTVALLVASALAALLNVSAFASYSERSEVVEFLQQVADRHQFDAAELRSLMRDVQIQKKVLKAIARPAESKPWSEYRPIFVTESRIRQGVEFWNDNASLLQQIADESGVPAEIMVAIIGVETRYGRHAGSFPALDTLATLAFDYPPRSAFFRRELEQFLLLVRDEGLDARRVSGSYAAAMGMPQFISSSYRHYAVDYDKDGRRDLWDSTPDVLGSVANYFRRHGWRRGEPITVRVAPADLRYRELVTDNLKPQHDYVALQQRGVAPAATDITEPYSVMELDGSDGAEVWVGYHNFYVITRYNHSHLYAMVVYQLAEALRAGRSTAEATE